MITMFEWAGSIFGLLGSFLLATNCSVSQYGWLAFSVANVAMIYFSMSIKRYGLLVQSLGFSGTTLLGLYRSNLWTSFAAFLSPAINFVSSPLILSLAAILVLALGFYVVKRNASLSRSPFHLLRTAKQASN